MVNANFKLKHPLVFFVLGLAGILISFMTQATDIEKSIYDKRTYEFLQLENGLKAIVVHDPEAIKSACSLEVNVGSLDEPDDVLGLAHFLEHMMFLGTEKFPKTDEFQTLLDHHGGTFNAFTGGERTHYYFNVQEGAFDEVLERFAEFFKTPLFNKELMDRERKNVDSEFQMYLNQDNWRVLDVNKATASPNHPFSRFSVGNMQTLGQDKEILHSELLKFFNTHYSADGMTLAMVGPQSLEQQVQWVKQHFSGVKQRQTPEKVQRPMFEAAQLGVDIEVEAKGNARQMALLFALPSFQAEYKMKPLHLLSQIFGYEGEGSLYDVLKKQGWITSLVSSTDEHPESQDLLQLQFSLTPEGFAHREEITQKTFEYIKTVKEQGYPKSFFNDIKVIHYLDFKYLERQSETTLASDLAHQLQYYPPKEVISSHFLSPEVTFAQVKVVLNKALSFITPQNMRRITISPDIEGNQETKWFKTVFKLQALPTVEAISTQDVKLSLPKENPYIPEVLTRESKDQVKAAIAPTLVQESKGLMLWHQNDKRFIYPKANIFVNFVNPLSLDSPKHQMVSNLFAQLVMEQLKLTLYPAIMLGEDIRFYNHSRGMTLQLAGYSDKQATLLRTLVNTLKNYQINTVDFELLKEKQLRDLKNFDQQPPFRQALQGLTSLYVDRNWHIEDLYVALQTISMQDIEAFKTAFLGDLKIEMLVNGNYSKTDAKRLAAVITDVFPLNSDGKTVPAPHIYQLTKEALRFKELSTDDKNHALALYVQNDEASIPAMAKSFVLSKLLMTPMYQNMRVERQIGYALGVALSLQQRVSGLIFYVQSPNYTPAQIYDALTAFWENTRPMMDALELTDLSQIQTSLTNELRDPPKTLSEQSSRFWSTIEIGRNEFELREEIAKAVESLTVDDVRAYYHDLVASNRLGKLAVVSKTAEQPAAWEAVKDWQALKEKAEIFVF